jgi:hypothetical protein
MIIRPQQGIDFRKIPVESGCFRCLAAPFQVEEERVQEKALRHAHIEGNQSLRGALLMKNARIIVGLAIAASFAIAAPAVAEDKFDGFLCCNMRTDGKWISDINYEESGKRIIPFGTPVKVIGYGRYRVRVVIEGRVQHIGNDYSRDLRREVFARRYVVPQDPRPAVSAASEKIRKAIESARVTNGMTKEQVLIAVGYPVSSENPNLDVPVWRYWLWSYSPFTVYFDDSGKVSRVDTDAATRPKVYLE